MSKTVASANGDVRFRPACHSGTVNRWATGPRTPRVAVIVE